MQPLLIRPVNGGATTVGTTTVTSAGGTTCTTLPRGYNVAAHPKLTGAPSASGAAAGTHSHPPRTMAEELQQFRYTPGTGVLNVGLLKTVSLHRAQVAPPDLDLLKHVTSSAASCRLDNPDDLSRLSLRDMTQVLQVLQLALQFSIHGNEVLHGVKKRLTAQVDETTAALNHLRERSIGPREILMYQKQVDEQQDEIKQLRNAIDAQEREWSTQLQEVNDKYKKSLAEVESLNAKLAREKMKRHHGSRKADGKQQAAGQQMPEWMAFMMMQQQQQQARYADPTGLAKEVEELRQRVAAQGPCAPVTAAGGGAALNDIDRLTHTLNNLAVMMERNSTANTEQLLATRRDLQVRLEELKKDTQQTVATAMSRCEQEHVSLREQLGQQAVTVSQGPSPSAGGAAALGKPPIPTVQRNAVDTLENVQRYTQSAARQELSQCEYCQRDVEARELADHIERCPKRDQREPSRHSTNATDEGECPFCGKETTKLADHTAQCPYRPVTCAYCGENYSAKNEAVHFSMCSKKPQKCKHCNVELEVGSAICEKSCMHCNKDFKCTEVQKHEAGCDMRMVRCEDCAAPVIFRLLSDHQAKCKKVPQSTMSRAGSTSSMRRDPAYMDAKKELDRLIAEQEAAETAKSKMSEAGTNDLEQ